MKKAIISNRIFVNFNEELYEKCKNELTYKIPNFTLNGEPTIKRTYAIIGHKFISIPVGRLDIIPKDYKIVDNRTLVPVKFPKFKYKLRDSQQKIYDLVEDNCLINANTSWGKTFTGIAIATKLKQRTLIITHTVNLRDQWVKEIKKTLGITPGIIGGGKLAYKNEPIVVSNIQTLRKHVHVLRKDFGLIILDEVHHCPAKMFEDTLNIMKARYKIGMSATLKRKDCLHVVIEDYFSNTVYKPPKENQMTPEIVMVESTIPFNSQIMIPWPVKVNELCARPEYIDLVSELSTYYADQGHKVLVVSDRTEFLDSCHMKNEDRSIMVYSKTKDRDYQHSLMERGEKDILYGAISIYKEGISLNWLSCLILATPINNDPLLEQLIGRVLREHPEKLTPLIIDIILSGSMTKRQSQARAGYYIRNEYKVKYFEAN